VMAHRPLRLAEEGRDVEADRLRRAVGGENADCIELSAVLLRQLLRDDAGARLLREDPPPLCANAFGLVTCTGDDDGLTAARSITSLEANVWLRRRKHGRSRHRIGSRGVRHQRDGEDRPGCGSRSARAHRWPDQPPLLIKKEEVQLAILRNVDSQRDHLGACDGTGVKNPRNECVSVGKKAGVFRPPRC
jgi:hypothetical protein